MGNIRTGRVKMASKCSALAGTSIAYAFLPRLEDHCGREGAVVRVRRGGEYKETVSSRQYRATAHVNSKWL